MVGCAPIHGLRKEAYEDTTVRTTLCRGATDHSRWGQQPGAGLSFGGRATRFIARAKGSRLYDVDENSYIDYVLSWGPMILGHAPASVTKAIQQAAANGTSYGAPTELEIQLATMIREALPSMELVRLVSSGTEAVMSAIRVARAYTKRDGILKFEGCYHGHSDYLLAKAGSGLATLGIPDCPGVPEDFTKHTLTAPYNDIQAVKQLIKKYFRQLACVIVEPIAGNMGVIPPRRNSSRPCAD